VLRVGPPLQPPVRVLVRLPTWLGDVVAAEPALRGLAVQSGDPDGGALSLAGPRALLPILEGRLPAARRIPIDGRRGDRAGDWRGHDVAVLFPNSFRSAWTAWRAGIPRRVGWIRDGRGLLLTDGIRPAYERGRVPLGLGRHGRGRRVLPRPYGGVCAELVGLVGAEVRDHWPRLVPGPWPTALAEWRERDYLLVNAGCRPGSAKGAPPELLGAALRAAGALELPALVVGGPGEEEAVRATVAAARGAPHPVVAALPDSPGLPELSALCAGARLAWTADAGPLHVLRAHRTPRVVLQGPTDPRHTAELLVGELRLREQVPCGPCHRERCPLSEPDHHRCMRALDPEALVAASLRLRAAEA